jgi:hypothetical protein
VEEVKNEQGKVIGRRRLGITYNQKENPLDYRRIIRL